MNALQGALGQLSEAAAVAKEKAKASIISASEKAASNNDQHANSAEHEELTNLCMKLNKRVKVLEKKYRYVVMAALQMRIEYTKLGVNPRLSLQSSGRCRP